MSSTPNPSLLDSLKSKLAAAHAERNKAIAKALDCRAKARSLEAEARDAEEVALRNEGVIAVLEHVIAEQTQSPASPDVASKGA